MNICLITIKSVFPPDHGANVRIYKTAEFLGKRGNNVHLLILNPHDPRFPNRPNVPREREVDIHPNVMVHWFRMHPNPLAFLLKSLSVPLAYPFLNLDTYIKLIEIVRDQSIDVIDSIYLSTALPALAVGRAFNIPVVITEEDLEYKVFLRERLYLNIPHNPVWLSMRGRMEAKLCNMCDHVVSVSEDDKRNLRRMGVHKPISVVPNATDTKTLRPDLDGSEVRRRYGVEDDETLIFFHGWLAWPANRDAVLKIANHIAPEIRKSHPKTKFMVTGPHPPRINNNVIVTGPCRHDEVGKFIAASDICVVPLVSGSGTRFKIVEYWACGKPVVSTRIGAEGLEARDGVNIFLTKNVDEAFVGYVRRLIDDEDLKAKLGEEGRKTAVKYYDWNAVIRNLEKIYREIIKQKLES